MSAILFMHVRIGIVSFKIHLSFKHCTPNSTRNFATTINCNPNQHIERIPQIVLHTEFDFSKVVEKSINKM